MIPVLRPLSTRTVLNIVRYHSLARRDKRSIYKLLSISTESMATLLEQQIDPRVLETIHASEKAARDVLVVRTVVLNLGKLDWLITCVD